MKLRNKKSPRRDRGLERFELGRLSRYERLEARRLLSITPPDYAALPLTTFDTNHAALSGGLDAVANWAKALDAYGAVGANVPIAQQSVAGQSIGGAVNLYDLLGTQFDTAVQSYLANTPGATADDLATFLNKNQQWVLPETGLALSATVTTTDLTTGKPGATMNGNDLVIGLDLHATRTRAVSLDLSSIASSSIDANSIDAAGTIGFDAAAAGTLTATFDFSFSFGLDLTTYLEAQSVQQQMGAQAASPAAQTAQFVLQATSPLTAKADFTQGAQGIADSQGNAITGHVGFLGVTLAKTGTIAVNDDLTLNLPSGDLHTSDFASPTLGGQLSVNGPGAGSLAATLPLQAVLSGSQTFNGTLNAAATPLFTTLAATTPAPLAPPTITGPDAATLTAFENATPNDILGGLAQLAGWFDGLRTQSLTAPVPYTADTLADVVDLKRAYAAAMAGLVDAAGKPAFATAQQLLALPAMSGVLSGIGYDASTNELTFQANVAPRGTATELPTLAVPLSLAGAGSLSNVTSAGTLSLSPTATIGFTFGMDLNPLGTEGPNPITASTPLSSLNGGSGVALAVGLTAANAFASDYGQLTGGDVTFDLTVNGGSTPVTIKQSDTSNNASVDDLVAELNTAIVSAFGKTSFAGDITAKNDNGTIVLAAIPSKPGAASLVTSLSLGGPTALGFTDGQVAGGGTLTAANAYVPSSTGTAFSLSINGNAYPIALSPGDLISAATAASALTTAITAALQGTNFANELSSENNGGVISLVASAAAGASGPGQITRLAVSGPAALGFTDAQTSDADLTITLRDGTSFTVSLKALGESATLADVQTAIQSAAQAADTTATLVPGATLPLVVTIGGVANPRGLTITDGTAGAGQFTIAAANESPAGASGSGLGIIGSDDQGNGIIVGVPLDGDSIDQHVFVRNVTVDAAAEFSGDVAATATLGIVPISVSGAASGSLAAALTIQPTGTPSDGGRIDLAKLFAPASSPGYSVVDTPSGAPELDLTGQLASAVLAAPAGTAATPLTLTWTAGDLDPKLAIGAAGILGAMASLGDSDVLAGFTQVATPVGGNSAPLPSLEQASALTAALPLVGRSLDGLVHTSANFAAALAPVAGAVADADAAVKAGTGSPLGFDALVAQLQKALGGAVTVSLDTSAASPALKFQLSYAPKAYNAQTGLDLDLGTLLSDVTGGAPTNLAGVTSLAGAQGSLTVAAGGELSLDLGLDLANPAAPQPFVYGDTKLTLDALASAAGAGFAATLNGLINLTVTGGSALLAHDSNAADGPATFSVGLASPTTRYYFDAAGGPTQFTGAGDLGAAAVVGAAQATLPLSGAGLPAGSTLGLTIGALAGELAGQAGSVTLSAGIPNLAAIASGAATGAAGNLAVIGGGLTALFDELQSTLAGKVFAQSLPIVGDQLASAVTFFSDLATGPIAQLQQALASASSLTAQTVQGDLFAALGPAGAKVLADLNGDGKVTIDDVEITQNSAGDVEFKIELAGQTTNNGALNFQSGLAGLGLNLGQNDLGNVNLTAGYSLTVGFGVDSGGFYLAAPVGADELKVTVAATIPGLNAQGKLGPVQVSATDNPADPSGLLGTFTVDLNPAGTPGHVYMADLPSLAANADATLTATAGLHLVLSVGIGAKGPSVSADFDVDWLLVNADTRDSAATFGGEPTVALDHVSIDVAPFVKNMLGPLFKEVQTVLAPVEPLLNLLTDDLPVLSSLGIHLSLLDLAESFGLATGAADFIQTAADVVNIASTIASFASTGGYDLGSYTLTGVDPRSAASLDGAGQSQTAAPEKEPTDLSNLANESDASGTPILQFPFIDNPASLVGLFLGQNPTLVEFNMPRLDVGFHWGVSIPIPVPLVSVTFAAGFDVQIGFSFGLDTRGLVTGNPADSFFIDDSQPQVKFTGSLTAGASVSVLIVTVGVDGGIFANVNLRLNDPDGDGKVRLAEIAQEGAQCLFDESGSIYAQLQAYVSIDFFFFHKKFTIPITPPITIVDFNHSCPPAPPPQPVLATMEAAGALALNMGPLAHNRLLGDDGEKDHDESFVIAPGPTANSVTVTDVGLTYDGGKTVTAQTFTNVSSITVDGGLGNNSITVEPGVALPVNIVGGGGRGSDTIYDYGSGPANLTGGGAAGDKIVYTGPGPATLYGGAGADTLDAGGSTGPVSIYGMGGADTITGGTGSDWLQAGNGNASIVSHSAAGNSATLVGGHGNQTLIAGSGNDLLEAGAGNATLEGGSGDDTLMGDTQPGAFGHESLVAGSGNDLLQAGSGNATLVGGAGNDTLIGGAAGDDLMLATGAGADIVEGGGASTVILAGPATAADTAAAALVATLDPLPAATGPGTLVGGAGDATIVAGAGNDLILAGSSTAMDDPATASGALPTKLIDGGAGHAAIYGDAGPETIFGGSGGSNTIYTGPGNATVFAGPGDPITHRGDSVVGGIGDDVITGGAGNDTLISGSAAGDHGTMLIGGGGNELLIAGQGNDSIWGGTGNDTIYGGAGHDLLVAGPSLPTPDSSFNDPNHPTPLQEYGSVAPDLIVGGTGQDTIYGDGGGDLIYGGTGGPNTIYAGYGQATVYAGPKGDYIVSGDAPAPATPATLSNFMVNGIPLNVPSAGGASVGQGPDLFVGGAGNDTIYGGLGHDTLLGGGGGNDLIVAGPGGAYLDAQGGSGTPTLIGGSGSDTLVLNTEPGSHAGMIEGYYPAVSLTGALNITNLGLPDPALTTTSATAPYQYQATDTLLINAESVTESVELAQTIVNSQETLAVNFTAPGLTRTVTAPWRDPSGNPLFEQFQINGGPGGQHIWFATPSDALPSGQTTVDFKYGLSPTDTSPKNLFNRLDFVSKIFGGAGNNTLGGTAGHDEIFGGPGSNVIYGVGGDDELYGDAAPGQIPAYAGADTIYAGSGNSDLFAGGSGSQLYAWSQDPALSDNAAAELGFADGQSAVNTGPLNTGTVATITAAVPPLASVLTSDVAFSLVVASSAAFAGGTPPVDISLAASATSGDQSLADLATALNQALAAAGLGGVANGTALTDVWAASASGSLTLSTNDGYLEAIDHQYGVYLDASGALHPDSGAPGGSGPFTLETTGYDRMLGAQGADSMYAGPGPAGAPALDFMYNPVGTAVIFDDKGNRAQDQSLPGETDALKAYAKSDPAIWYFQPAPLNDNITVNYGKAHDAQGNATAPIYWIGDNTGPFFDLTFYTADTNSKFSDTSQENDPAYSLANFDLAQTPQAIVVATNDGANTVEVKPNVGIPVWIVGGKGNDYFHVDPFDFAGSIDPQNGETFDSEGYLRPTTNTPPRDVMIAGNGNDTMLGGSGNEWIFGGSGTNWISGGLSSSSTYGNLLYGGTGPTTFQILPFDTTTPTPDTIVGQSGDDRILYVGRNDAPDFVSVGYDPTNHLYELGSLVAVNSDKFLTSNGSLEQRFASFTASGVAHFEIAVDTAGSVVDAAGSLSSSLNLEPPPGGGGHWGFLPGVLEQGATLESLDIRAYGGNDTVFGGAGDDTISGNGGYDLFVGGGGSNTIAASGTKSAAPLAEAADGAISAISPAANDQLFGHGYINTLTPSIGTTPDNGTVKFDPEEFFPPNPADQPPPAPLWFEDWTPPSQPTATPTDPPLVVDGNGNPVVAPPGVTLPGSGAPGAPTGAQPISNAFSLAGLAPSQVEDVGDLTGNGIDDYLVTEGDNIYVLFGPVKISDHTAIAQQADLVGSVGQLGMPASKMGDVNGDGINDLLFVTQSGNTFTFTTIPGAANLAHQLASSGIVSTLTDGNVGANASAQLVDYVGDGNADLLLSGPGGSDVFPANGLLTAGTITASSIAHYAAPLSAADVGNFTGTGQDAIVTSQSPNNVAAPSGLVGWWRGEGNANDSAGTDNGTAIGGVTYTSGVFGQAFNFPAVAAGGAAAYVDLGQPASLDLPGNLSVSMWVQYRTLNQDAYLFSDYDSSGEVSQGSLDIGSATRHFTWFQSTKDGHQEFEGKTALSANTWYFVSVVRYDSLKTVTIYVNGQLDGTMTYTGTVVGLQGDVTLGGVSNTASDSIDGLIDEAQIYNRALSPGEVQLLSGEASVLADGTSAWFPTPANTAISRVFPLGDINHDGYADFAVAEGGANPAVLIFEGNAQGTLAPSVTIPLPTALDAVFVQDLATLSITAGDFNGDGLMDLALALPDVANADGSKGAVYVAWSAFTTTSSPSFTPVLTGVAANPAATPPTPVVDITGLAATPQIDVNGDGIDDLLVSASGGGTGAVYVVYGAAKVYSLPMSGATTLADPGADFAGNQYLVGDEKNTPQVFPAPTASGGPGGSYTLPTGGDSWYTFTTQGDGQSQNTIVLSPGSRGEQTTWLAPSTGTLVPDPSAPGGGYDVTPTALEVGNGTGQGSGVVELDLSSLLPYVNTPSVIQNATLALNYDKVVGSGTLNLSVLDAGMGTGATTVGAADLLKGDGVVNSLDIVNPATGQKVPTTPVDEPDGTTPYSWPLSSLTSPGILPDPQAAVGIAHPTGIDLTDLVLAALKQGKTRLTLRFDLTPASGTSASIELLPPAGTAASATGLAITTAAPGVEGELFNASGAHVGSTGPVIDMAGLPAGTYYLHVFDPNTVTPLAPVGWASPTTTLLAPSPNATRATPLAYMITITPPVAGQANDPPVERATIFAGGSSTLFGGSGIDQLFGDDTDTFQGQPSEPRDYAGDGLSAPVALAPAVLPAPGTTPATQVDPPVTVPDYGLKEAIAEAAGIAWTAGADGAMILSRPILQSDLLQLTTLDASDLNVADLTGLQYATNLVSLDLANDALTNLNVPVLNAVTDPASCRTTFSPHRSSLTTPATRSTAS